VRVSCCHGFDHVFDSTLRACWCHHSRTTRPAPFPALRSGNALAHLYPSAERLDPVLLRFDRAYRLVRDNDVRDAFRLATTALEELPAAHRTGMVRAYTQDFLDSMPIAKRRSAVAREFATAMRE
jgi:hypothetical protein